VEFTRLVGGVRREEVCRFLLSSLMLANTGNVEVCSGPALSMDSLRLTLLSTARHHEQLTGFQAASQQGSSSQPGPSQPGPSHQASSSQQGKRARAPDSPPKSPGQARDPDSPFRVPAPPKGKKGRKRP